MNIPYDDIGLAGVQTDTFTQIELFAGDTPPVVTDYGILGATLATPGIPAWTPVIVNAATRAITLPVQGTSKANAITVAPVAAGSPATCSVPVYKAGMFNINAVKFGADFDTEAKQLAAFDMSECQIYVKKPFYG